MNEDQQRWMRVVLRAAALYNIAFGIFAIFTPFLFFRFAEMPPPLYPELWQCIGMIVGVYGVGYWIASSDPLRHWPIVFVGLLGKILGPLGYLQNLLIGRWSLKAGLLIVTNDLIWIPFFSAILLAALKHWTDPAVRGVVSPEHEAWADQQMNAFMEASKTRPQLVVFLRHFGCTFCREWLADLSTFLRNRAPENGDTFVINMADVASGEKILKTYGITGVTYLADPSCALYRRFGLRRGTTSELFGLRSIRRGIDAFFHGRHLLGKLEGDGFQMPGVFILLNGSVVQSYIPSFAGEKISKSMISSYCTSPDDNSV